MNKSIIAIGTSLGVAIAVALGLHATRVEAEAPAERIEQMAPAVAATSAGGVALPDFRTIVRENIASIVKIEVSASAREVDDEEMDQADPFGQLFRRFGRPQPMPRGGTGSGFVVSSDGTILTNAHVVKGADEITVRMNDQRTFKAELIGLDEQTDVAVIKVKGKDLPPVRLGDSDKLEVGEWVLAIGSPFQMDFSATQGIVSATGRNLPGDQLVPFIQTDAAVNPGNSGGPLFNARGEVIGINSQILSGSGGYMGLSFAIPIKTAMNISSQLRSTGRVERGWLGVGIQAVTPELAEQFGLDRASGALVGQIDAKGPALGAGLKPGDVILRFDGQNVRDSGDLPPMVTQTPVGKKVPVEIVRDGERQTLYVTLARRPETQSFAAQGEQAPAQRQTDSLAVSELTDEQKRELDVDSGVVITDLRSRAAMSSGLQEGDVVLEINRKKITSAGEFEKALAAAKGKTALMLIKRQGQTTFLVVEDLS
jgi:serine protease Do